MRKFCSFLLFIPLLLTALMAQDRITGRAFSTRSEVIARHGMVCSSQPLATQAGIDILKKGGSAIDAAIAVNACLALMEPVGCGLGGDLFAIVWDAKSKRLYGLNASGRSPQSLSLSQLKQTLESQGLSAIPPYGALPVSVPGCVDGWAELHKKFGKLKFDQVLAPAISYAREGFPVSELIAYYWGRNSQALKRFPNFEETFMPGGKAPAKGEIFRNPYLANTLEEIAKKGRDAFYKGEIARIIATEVQQNGGFLQYEDLANHHSEWVEPASVNYRGYDVWELPPNGQGISALQMLNILEGYELSRMGFGSAEYLHVLTEAKKLAFEDRASYYADPAFSRTPLEQLLSKAYASERRALINPNRAGRSYPAGILKQSDTIYLCVADEEGNMISLIQSNFRGMGSGITPKGLGFVLQDRGELFALEEGHANVYAPGKRPFHTIIPAFVTRGGVPFMSFGVMGGDMQPQGHVQILVNIIDFGMDLQAAGDAPRMCHEGSSSPTGDVMKDGGVLYVESGIPYESVRQLVQMGHKVQAQPGIFGGYQAIRYDPVQKVYYGASESRKDGHAAGY